MDYLPSYIDDLLRENQRRNEALYSTFNPITGEGSILERQLVKIADHPLSEQWLPVQMLEEPLIKAIVKEHSISRYISRHKRMATDVDTLVEVINRIRCRYDFPYWAYMYVRIKNKSGGDDIPFRLNSPQRTLVSEFEKMRIAGQPIRLILLKARQWGGSTVTQIYMAWIQLVHMSGWNSLIVGHVKDASVEVRDMFDKMLAAYPMSMLYPFGEDYDEHAPKITGVPNALNIRRVPSRNAKIKIGTAENPETARGGDSALVHCTEVAFWRKTDGKTPEQIVRSACSGTTLMPYTMIVYESTANGVGNFFQREYDAAKRGNSNFVPLFIPWYEIEKYSKPIDDIRAFAERLVKNRNADIPARPREESGAYYWQLWNSGATLESINWYMTMRSTYDDHADMAAEYPSNDVEAFKHSGASVFPPHQVEPLRTTTMPPRYIGDLQASAMSGAMALEDIEFIPDEHGQLTVWEKPDIDENDEIADRYLVVVDIGGRGAKADYSVVCVFDRLFMMDGGKPAVVAQWYGHIDMDLLAWKSAQIARWYDNALLVIESNTLETKDRDRIIDGAQAPFILNQLRDVYDNLYARAQSDEDIREGIPRKYGFHTNVSTKPMIISNLVRVVRERLYTERDTNCLDEMVTYERKPNGSYGAVVGKHDDLLMTRAIGLHICFNEMPTPRIIQRGHSMARIIAPSISEATI